MLSFLIRWVTEASPFSHEAAEVFSRSKRLITSFLKIRLEKYLLRKKGKFTAAFHTLCCCVQTHRGTALVKGKSEDDVMVIYSDIQQ